MTYANASHTRSAFVSAMKGISNPVLVDLPPGTELFRFVDIHRGPHRIVANSPWWFEFEHFHHIEVFAKRFEHDLRHCARLFLAVLHEYSEITGYVSARTTVPLKALKGRGSVVYSSGKDRRDPAKMAPMQGFNEIYQLYIPGLFRGSPVFEEAFERVRYERID